MEMQSIPYSDGSTALTGWAFTQDTKQKRPLVLVAHAWRGQDAFAKRQAERLAELGFVGFALDNYGNQEPIADQEAPNWMLPLFLDREALQKRLAAGFDAALNLPFVDPENVGAIGFCFGGLCVLELLRSGKSVKGVVSFHPVISSEIAGHKAKEAKIHPQAKGASLILYGHDDPLVNTDELEKLEQEFSSLNIDWQVHVYGNTMHAFTNPGADNPIIGNKYNPISAKRAFTSMETFFKEKFT